ncbi:MAG: hypothetical protein AAFU58_06140, partial [Pseudomonadota bacterium]
LVDPALDKAHLVDEIDVPYLTVMDKIDKSRAVTLAWPGQAPVALDTDCFQFKERLAAIGRR